MFSQEIIPNHMLQQMVKNRVSSKDQSSNAENDKIVNLSQVIRQIEGEENSEMPVSEPNDINLIALGLAPIR